MAVFHVVDSDGDGGGCKGNLDAQLPSPKQSASP